MRNKKVKNNIEIHYHEFPIYAKFLIFRKLIGYWYMKCGTDYSSGYGRYPDGLPESYVGVNILGIGKFGDCPKSINDLEENKDSQGAKYI